MRGILQPIRFILILFSIIVYLGHMAIVWFVVRQRWARVRWANRILSYYSKWGLWLLKVKVNLIGAERIANAGNALYVGNHLSYMDVLVINSRIPACFVTSMEIKNTTGLGLICQMAGCLFVERRNKMNLKNEVAELSEGLRNGVNVAIFPEATSTNGEQILRFRSPLYYSAIESGRPVLPFCLNYKLVGGSPINPRSRDTIFWYGDMDFIPHLWALAGNGGTVVDLNILEALHPRNDEDAKALAERSQAAVEAIFKPVKTNQNEN